MTTEIASRNPVPGSRFPAPGFDVRAEIRGLVRPGDKLIIGPLVIERAEHNLVVRLEGKAEVLLPARGLESGFWARTDGRLYPLLAKRNQHEGGGTAQGKPGGTGDAAAPLVSFGQGTSRRVIREEDV